MEFEEKNFGFCWFGVCYSGIYYDSRFPLLQH